MSARVDRRTLLERIGLDDKALADFCQRWSIVELDVFGSALRDDFKTDSDVDLLVTFAPRSAWSVFDLAQMQEELGKMIRRPVDLLTRRGVERSSNWIRRQAILDSAKQLYVEPGSSRAA
jgi:uncharacterized protein